MALLDKWAIIIDNSDPYYEPSELLTGKIFGDSRFEDGSQIQINTTAIQGKKGGLVVTFAGNEYELGEPQADHVKQFPGAEDEFLSRLKHAYY